MKKFDLTRRAALKSTLGWAGAAVVASRLPRAVGFELPLQRPRVGIVGAGSRWHYLADDGRLHGTAQEFIKYGDYTAVCDVDAQRVEKAAELVSGWSGGRTPTKTAEYRDLLAREDVDVIHISTPDHWHAKVAVEAMLAGKDVYVEKPMTLTIAEGQLMCEVAEQTGRVVQVGTQQRSDANFLRAVAMVREGRLGEIKRAVCGLNPGPTSPEIPVVQPPKHLGWDRWLGPVGPIDYRHLPGDHGETKAWSNCHYEFRWWYDFSGGKLTDWGAHHVDIATWAMGKEGTGPVSVEPLHVVHPVPFADGQPTDPSRYNTATEFVIRAAFEDGQEIEIRHDGDNGILFEGTEGRIFVNRGKLAGAAAEELQRRPLPEGAIEQVYKGRPPAEHAENFFRCLADRSEPVSDVVSHHRALTTCHLAAIAARLGRTLRWDAAAQQIVGDPQAAGFLAREPRDGYAIQV